MFVSIHEQVSGNTLRSCAEEERKAICFSVPICASAVLFTGKTLGTDIQTFIISGIRLHQLKNIEAYPLLCRGVSGNRDVILLPLLFTCTCVCREQLIVSFGNSLSQNLAACSDHVFFRMVFRGKHGGVLVDNNLNALLQLQLNDVAGEFL